MTTIQKPSLGRVVIFTAWRGNGSESGKVDEYAGVVVKVHPIVAAAPNSVDPNENPGDMIDIVTLGSASVYHNNRVRYDGDGAAGTWRYPPHEKAQIEV